MKNNTTLPAALSLVVFVVVLLSACSSNSVTELWTAPDVSKISFRKIVVIATSPDGAVRRAAEDAMKAQIRSAECVTSYTLLGGESELKNLAKVIAAFKAAGAEGVIVLRPVSDRNEITYTPGAVYPVPYRTFRGYYARPYALRLFYQEPDRVSQDRIVQFETSIYEVAGERLIWSAATTSTNPENLQALITEAAAVIRAELVRQKLIPPS